MSTPLDAIEAAVRANIAEDHPGQLVIGWAVVAAVTDPDENLNVYEVITPKGQPAHHTVGLFSIGTNNMITGGDGE